MTDCRHHAMEKRFIPLLIIQTGVEIIDIDSFQQARCPPASFFCRAVINAQLSTATTNINAALAENDFMPVNPLVRVVDNEEIIWLITAWDHLPEQAESLCAHVLCFINDNPSVRKDVSLRFQKESRIPHGVIPFPQVMFVQQHTVLFKYWPNGLTT